ncbi:MAG TPA: hypothetical protein ENI27_07860 [bacterium]|nr:hypothetical protein [bacterium]
MMMFAFFPLFAVFFLLFFSDSLERTLFRRSYKQRETYPNTETTLLDQKDISSSTGKGTSQVHNRLQVTVFRLAARNNGRLTLSDVIVETGLDLNKAEKLMDRMVDGAHVQIDVNDKGMIFYEFPEIISRTEHEEV